MTELDFDELDKAVSTIMSGVDTSKRKEGFDDPEDKVIEIPTTSDVSAGEPTVALTSDADNDTVVTSTVATPVQEAKPAEPLAVKRRGQFMDVMHPSSDMKTMIAPRRDGVSLQPTSPFVTSAPAATPEEEPMSIEPTEAPVIDIVAPLDAEPATSETPRDEIPESSSAQSWPDPIDVVQDTDAIRDTDGDGITNDVSVAIDTVPEDVVNEVAAPTAEEPITSPFIADAKVEKRPLGTAAPFPESVATPDAPQPESVVAVTAPLPEELKTDVMSLESSSTVVNEKTYEPEVAKSNIPGSIPQQYTEQPSTGDASNSAIYDTSTHHQPLDGGVQKSSPMKWIILGLVLLIIGALAGAAYFYFKTQ